MNYKKFITVNYQTSSDLDYVLKKSPPQDFIGNTLNPLE